MVLATLWTLVPCICGVPMDAGADVPPSTPVPLRTVEYTCGSAGRLTVTFQGRAARFVDGEGRKFALEGRPVASGFLYHAGEASLRGNGDDLTWRRAGAEPLQCRAVKGADQQPPPTIPGVSGTHWQLVQFQSSNPSVGTLKPDDPARYTLELARDGRLSMRLDCNQATGRWSGAAASSTSGALSLTPLAVTRAACPPGSMASRIAADSASVDSYTLAGDTLKLGLVPNSGVYTWRRVER